MADLAFVDIDYCQFSRWGYKKPTRFWGVFPGGKLKNVVCDGLNCMNLANLHFRVGGPHRHRVQLSGNRVFPGTKDHYRLPPDAIRYLLGKVLNPVEQPAHARSLETGFKPLADTGPRRPEPVW